MERKVDVTTDAQVYVKTVLAPKARPRMEVGNSSDVNNQVNGPKDMEYPITTIKIPGNAKNMDLEDEDAISSSLSSVLAMSRL
mmetsp:Transcript_9635/g.22126  ORF Transcript_9635/g.22126 Transcript_9635/m.22126 type:complete len:83 (+) Transcript_9635:468-716(+)